MDNLLEKAACEGVARITKTELNLWFGQTRFSINMRRYICERWEEVAEGFPLLEEEGVLLVELSSDILFMIGVNIYDSELDG